MGVCGGDVTAGRLRRWYRGGRFGETVGWGIELGDGLGDCGLREGGDGRGDGRMDGSVDGPGEAA